MQQLILNLFWLMDSGIITCISSQLFFVWFSGRRWRGSLKKILYALLLRDYCNFWSLSSRTGWLAWMLDADEVSELMHHILTLLSVL
jgi:hypothetical protein